MNVEEKVTHHLRKTNFMFYILALMPLITVACLIAAASGSIKLQTVRGRGGIPAWCPLKIEARRRLGICPDTCC